MNAFMDSANTIYCLTYSSSSNLIYISAYSFSTGATTLTPTYSKSYGSSINVEIGVAALFIPSKSYILTTGSH